MSFSAFHILRVSHNRPHWPALLPALQAAGPMRCSVWPACSFILLFHNSVGITRFRARFLFPSTFYTKKTPCFFRFCASFVYSVQTVVHSARPAPLARSRHGAAAFLTAQRGHAILGYISTKEVYPSPWHAAPATTPAPGS